MSDTAAHLVDRVFPRVPVRQWVLSLPRPMRYVLARDAKLLGRALRIFVSEIVRHLKRKTGHHPSSEVLAGAVTSIQRFGGALNLNPHLHSLVLDGAYVWDDEAQVLRFQALAEPSQEELERILSRVRHRLRMFLASRGFTAFEPPSPDSVPPEACEELSLFDRVQSTSIQECLTLSGEPRRVPAVGRRKGPLPAPEGGPLCVSFDGFSLQAAVRIRKGDREGLERLARYVTRPSFSGERLELLPDGRVSYEFRRPRRDGSTHLVLRPLELMEKLAALVPPPRSHLLVYSGILGPRCRARRMVVPAGNPAPSPEAGNDEACGRRPRGEEPHDRWEREAPRSREAPTGPGRTDWATLLRRTFALDVLSCPRCSGRLKVIATITEPEPIRAILRCLGHPEDSPRASPARPPPDPGLEFVQAS